MTFTPRGGLTVPTRPRWDRSFWALLAMAMLAAWWMTPGSAQGAPAPTAPTAVANGKTSLGSCQAGRFCLWQKTGFRGKRHGFDLTNTDIESCVALPKGVSASSLGNETGRPVTVFQSAHCAETAEFHTYPTGSWAPKPRYEVRAFKIRER